MTVLQNWLEEISIRMQSTLILSLRGPDTHRCPEIKKVQRWMRGLVFKPGNPDNVLEFMTSHPPQLKEKNDLARELEFCSQHFYSHLMHGLQVIAYQHPDYGNRQTAGKLYHGMCDLFHLPVEHPDAFEKRLETRFWPGDEQPDTFEDAVRLLQGASA